MSEDAAGSPGVGAAASAADGADVEKLRRWEDSGAIWQVLHRTPTRVTIALMTCTANEEVDRVVTDDPRVLEFIGDRTSSDPTA